MLNRLPKSMPPLSAMLDDIGQPRPQDLARALGVSTRTVYSWMANDEAPRPALLSIFWLTRWGQQWLDVDLFNYARAQTGLAEARGRELDRVQAQPPAQVKTAPEGRPMLYVVSSRLGKP